MKLTQKLTLVLLLMLLIAAANPFSGVFGAAAGWFGALGGAVGVARCGEDLAFIRAFLYCARNLSLDDAR